MRVRPLVGCGLAPPLGCAVPEDPVPISPWSTSAGNLGHTSPLLAHVPSVEQGFCWASNP